MDTDKIRNILNIVFMLLALVAVIVYFTAADQRLFIYACGAAVVVKIAESFLRFTKRK